MVQTSENLQKLELSENLETEAIHEAQRRSSLSAASLNQGSIFSEISAINL